MPVDRIPINPSTSIDPETREAIADTNTVRVRKAMNPADPGSLIQLRNILFLTDFSEPSEAALPFAMAIAREYDSGIHALHVLLPEAIMYSSPEATLPALQAQEECAAADMQRTESQLAGLTHEGSIVRCDQMWKAVEQAIDSSRADLIVLGTHGRTGARKVVLGSVAEEVFRTSPIPVLTIGPGARGHVHGAARFHRVLYATDFSPESAIAAPYAVSFAQGNQAQLILMHVLDGGHPERGRQPMSIADCMHALLELVPPDAELWCRPEPVVQYGTPAERILAEAKGRNADLIVLGVRSAAGRVRLVTRMSRSVAYQVVANATCPVLTVRA
ncbi:MAG TPA: universal stress protein [Candidatus Solibacter sp.]|nr:universal stress protein [Candidatus Solibacter sp.]